MTFMKKSLRTIWLVLLALTWASPAAAAKVVFKVDTWAGPPVRVYATRPVHLAADRPVVFVMHGVNRNADEYRDLSLIHI